MKILSLFDGYSTIQQACKNLGIKVDVCYASEIDPYAIAVTQSNFPETIQLGSVKNISFDNSIHRDSKRGLSMQDYGYKSDIDLMIGGSPCQDLSIAKRDRKGLDGERSGLFWEYVRILNEVKPKYFILENVASMPKEAKDLISKTLGVEPIMINASLVSAQNRKRLFWTNIPNITQPEDRGILLRDILEPKVDEHFYVKDQSNTVRISGRGSSIDDKHNWETIRIGSLNSGGQGDRIYSQDGKSVALSANGGGRGAKTGLYCVGNLSGGPWDKRHESCRRVYSPDGQSPTIPAGVGGGVTPKVEVESQIRKLTPIECLRLQSMPDDYFDKALYKGKPISNSQRYKMCGNAFNCKVIEHILKHIK